MSNSVLWLLLDVPDMSAWACRLNASANCSYLSTADRPLSYFASPQADFVCPSLRLAPTTPEP